MSQREFDLRAWPYFLTNFKGFIGGLALPVCTGAALFLGAPESVQGALAQLPTAHARAEVVQGKAAYVNQLPPTSYLKVSIVLPLRNEDELDKLLQQLYDPRSPNYHHFLSVQQFTEKFAPSQQDYDAVVQYAQDNDLVVTGTAANRLVVDVKGSVQVMEKAFHVNMGIYQHPTESRHFFAADREPSLDLSVPIWHIHGLDNFSLPRPMNLVREAHAKSRTSGSGPSGYFLASDFRAAYYGNGPLTGAGQAIGLVEFAGYEVADVSSYYTRVGQHLTAPIVGVSVDGSSLACTGSCDDSEQVLDIDAAIGIAPGVSGVYVYVSDTNDVAIFNRIATDNIAKNLSCSWGWSPADTTSDDPIFKEFAAQGQTLFVAAGDSGAYHTNSQYVYPADDPYVVSVGGTDLTTNGPGGTWKSETSWSSSGGGISPNRIAIPSWQKTAITSTNKGSTKYRNAPDVAAEANTDNYICSNGTCAGGWGGTSFAAPRWAGYMALVNQQSVAHGHGPVGFINAKLYTIGLGTSYNTNFHDITSGSNGLYRAIKGYDLVTGWGSPNGAALINSLAP